MWALDVAAFDSVFFAHHGNIDRFWDYWYQWYKRVPHYFDGQTFGREQTWTFYDAKVKSYMSVRPEDMWSLDGLGYTYDPPTNVPLLKSSVVLSGVADGGLMRFDPEGLERGRQALGQHRSNALLPTVARFALPHETDHGSYKVLVRLADGPPVELGEFSLLGMHSAMGLVPAFGSFTNGELQRVLAGSGAGLHVETQPRIRGLKVVSLDFVYPADARGWESLLSQ